MKILQIAMATLMTVVLTTAASAADNKKLLIGKWEATKVDEGTLPKGTIVEFTDDGKLKVTAKKGDKDETVTGKYTADADSFTYTFTFDGMDRSQKITIKKISETELDTANPEGKVVVFKRVK